MSIANLCVLHGYSNGEGWYEERLRKALSWKGLPFEAKVKHGILWFATAVERGRKFKTRTLKSAGLRHPKPFHQPSCKPPAPNLFQAPSPGDPAGGQTGHRRRSQYQPFPTMYPLASQDTASPLICSKRFSFVFTLQAKRGERNRLWPRWLSPKPTTWPHLVRPSLFT